MRIVALGIAALLTVATVVSTDAISTGLINFWLSLTERQQEMVKIVQPLALVAMLLIAGYKRYKHRKAEGRDDGQSAH